MPDTRTHDVITLISGAVLVPICYTGFSGAGYPPEAAITQTGLVVGAHVLSGLLFSPDLDLNSQIDNRWGVFYWIWLPYMWLVPHRHFWSHGLILPPLLRLLYFYLVVVILLVGGSWLLAQVGIVLPNYQRQLTSGLLGLARDYPRETTAFAFGFVTGGAAHSIADWLVTGGKYVLRGLGIRVRRDYSNHDRWYPRSYRRRSWLR